MTGPQVTVAAFSLAVLALFAYRATKQKGASHGKQELDTGGESDSSREEV